MVQFAAGKRFGDKRDTLIRCGGTDQQHLIVEADAGRGGLADIGDALRLEPQSPFLPLCIMQQAEVKQVGWCAWSARQRGEEAPAAHGYHGDRCDAVAAQAGIAAEAMTDRNIHTIGGKVGKSARGGDIQFDLGMLRAEPAEAWDQPGLGKGGGCTDGEDTGVGGCLEAASGLADLAEGVTDRGEIALAGFGEHQRAVIAAEELRSEPLFQAAHKLADGTRCD